MDDQDDFEWDEIKDFENQIKHGVSFYEAQFAFFDKRRVIAEDLSHSKKELRYFCFGLNESKTGILTVRFTYRHKLNLDRRIRIIGAGYWRKGKKIYEQANSIQ